jgi:hypothetical protein
MFTADVLSPNLFAEYWLAIGVVQRLLLTRDEVVWKLAKHCRGDAPVTCLFRKAKFSKGQVLERQVLERPGS